jgi:hypothetical protein
VSKKAAKRTKAAPAPPLDSPHWWPRAKTVTYWRKHKGEIADGALTAAVNAGKLGLIKVEWVDHQTNPPALLSAEDYEFGPYISSNFLVVRPRRPDVPPLPRPYTLFFWGPKVKELCPMEEAEASTVAASSSASNELPTDAPPRRRPGPVPEMDWKRAVVRELLKRAKAGKPLPSAPDMLKFCEEALGGEPDIRSMQELLRPFGGEMWHLLGLG